MLLRFSQPQMRGKTAIVFSSKTMWLHCSHTQLDQRGQQGLVNTKPDPALAEGLDWMISRGPSQPQKLCGSVKHTDSRV